MNGLRAHLPKERAGPEQRVHHLLLLAGALHAAEPGDPERVRRSQRRRRRRRYPVPRGGVPLGAYHLRQRLRSGVVQRRGPHRPQNPGLRTASCAFPRFHPSSFMASLPTGTSTASSQSAANPTGYALPSATSPFESPYTDDYYAYMGTARIHSRARRLPCSLLRCRPRPEPGRTVCASTGNGGERAHRFPPVAAGLLFRFRRRPVGP